MRNIVKTLTLLVLVAAFVEVSNAASYYWTTTDQMLNKSYLNIRVVQTPTEEPPTTTSFGKDIQVSSGPFKSLMDARTNCEQTIKEARRNAKLTNNYCSTVEKAR